MVNRIVPATISHINPPSSPGFHLLENITSYVEACSKFGMPKESLFNPVDLYEGKTIIPVLNSIHLLGVFAKKVGFQPILESVLREEEFMSKREQPNGSASPTSFKEIPEESDPLVHNLAASNTTSEELLMEEPRQDVVVTVVEAQTLDDAEFLNMEDELLMDPDFIIQTGYSISNLISQEEFRPIEVTSELVQLPQHVTTEIITDKYLTPRSKAQTTESTSTEIEEGSQQKIEVVRVEEMMISDDDMAGSDISDEDPEEADLWNTSLDHDELDVNGVVDCLPELHITPSSPSGTVPMLKLDKAQQNSATPSPSSSNEITTPSPLAAPLSPVQRWLTVNSVNPRNTFALSGHRKSDMCLTKLEEGAKGPRLKRCNSLPYFGATSWDSLEHFYDKVQYTPVKVIFPPHSLPTTFGLFFELQEDVVDVKLADFLMYKCKELNVKVVILIGFLSSHRVMPKAGTICNSKVGGWQVRLRWYDSQRKIGRR